LKSGFFSSTAIIVFLAAALAILLFWLLPIGRWSARQTSDYLGFYEPVARSLLAGRGLVAVDGSPALVYPPGFPSALALLFWFARWTGTPEAAWIQGFTLLALGVTSCLLYQLAQGLLGRRRALLTAALWITCPFHLWVARQPHSEIPFLLVFSAMLVVYAGLLARGESREALLCGVLCGVAGLIRPIVVFLPLVLAIALLVTSSAELRRSLRNSVLIVAGFLVVVAPWEGWAYARTGKIILLSTAGPMGVVDGLTFGVEQRGVRGDVDVPAGVRAIMNNVSERYRRGELRTMSAVVAVVRDEVRRDPGSFARLVMWKAARAWYGTDAIRSLEWYALIVQLSYFALAIPGSIVWWREDRAARPWLIASGLIILYFWAMSTLVLSIVRYMTPVLGLVLLSASVSADRLLGALNSVSGPKQAA